MPLDKNLKEIEAKLAGENNYTVDQRDDTIKYCERLSKLLN